MRKDFSRQTGQRIAIHTRMQTQYLDIKDITHIDSKDSVVSTHTLETVVTASQQLKDFEEELHELGFIRINRTTLINEAHIKTYTGGDKKKLELVNGEVFTVSRRKAHLLK